ncbi:MAG: hypothetical protein QXV17_12315 [Candidatus Micrarchaeaceae archaeon]
MTDQLIDKDQIIENLKKEVERLRTNLNHLKEHREKRALENQLLDISKIGVEKLLDLAKELIRTANSNPVIGYIIGFIITDILYRSKIIDSGTAKLVNISLGIMMGANISGTILQDITDVTHVFGKGGTSSKEFQPSATTIVYADNSTDSQLMRALQSREGVKG